MVELFRDNRRRLLDRLPEGTAAFIYAGEPKQMSQDDDYRFLVDRNFYYLTGLELPGLALILVKKDGVCSQRLFAFPHDEHEERWHGKRPDFRELSDISGIDISDIKAIDEIEEESYALLKDPSLRPAFDGSSIMNQPRKMRKQAGSIRTNDDILDIKDILTAMRLHKSAIEADMIRNAASITEEAIEAVREMIVPGITESDIHARLEYEMRRRGSEIFAFATIVSSGRNAFYLHHDTPEKDGDGVIADGSFVQIDAGARFNGYCGDISRVFFVGYGTDEDDKRIVLLDLISDLRRACFENIKPGLTFNGLNKMMHNITYEFLKEHGLIQDGDEVSVAAHKYYWHNTSHHLGLDVHDLSNSLPKDYRDMPFEAGYCLAVEPGVYIPEWGVGFRIEDDVMITADGCELLSSGNKGDIPEVVFC